jgi:hypothetical protein
LLYQGFNVVICRYHEIYTAATDVIQVHELSQLGFRDESTERIQFRGTSLEVKPRKPLVNLLLSLIRSENSFAVEKYAIVEQFKGIQPHMLLVLAMIPGQK